MYSGAYKGKNMACESCHVGTFVLPEDGTLGKCRKKRQEGSKSSPERGNITDKGTVVEI